MVVDQKASDLHFHSGSPLRLRIDGDFLTVPGGDLPPTEIRHLVESVLEPTIRRPGPFDLAGGPAIGAAR